MGNTFIEQVASLVRKHAPSYGILVYSPIIAQFFLESGNGTSNKVKITLEDGTVEWRHNYAGLKWRNNRCAISNDYFEEGTAEQNANGSYSNIVDKFFKFNSLEDCVIGYFQFTNISAYANLKGVTDPLTYLENIQADGYATSLKYVSNLMAVIEEYNLTQYDPVTTESDKKMVINVHAGHNPDGMVACGAIGLIKESTENRNVKNEVIRQLRALGHTVYDCTCENGTSKSDVLSKIVSKCNEHDADLDVSIHFNAGSSDPNNSTTGTEVFIYNDTSKAKPYAQNVARAIAELGFKLRDDSVKDDVKNASYLYVLKNTKAPAMLIECCFVDDKDDVALYNCKSMAEAIVYGITGQKLVEDTTEKDPEEKKVLYRVQVGAYSIKSNAERKLAEIKAAGFDGFIVEV